MQKPWMPVVAGILDIISGAMGLVFGLFMALHLHFPRFAQAAGRFGGAAGGAPGAGTGGLAQAAPAAPAALFPGMGLPFGIAAMVIGVLAIVGGVYALKVKTWGLALAGSIAAVITGRVLGVVALIFVVLGKKDFQK